MNNKGRKKKQATLKTELKARRERCKQCDAWECGYCGIPKWNLKKATTHLDETKCKKN